MMTSEVENYPGFPEGIQGPELMERMRKQAERFGTVIKDEQVTGVDFSKQHFSVTTENAAYQGKSVIVATGADTLWTNAPGEAHFIGKGVSSCAPCDAFFYRNKNVIVVGGGDSAMEEALVLTKFASHVTVVHRRNEFRASKIMQDRVKNHEKIDILWNTTVEEIIGDQKVTGAKLKTDGKIYEKPIDGVFVAIGHSPNSKIFSGVLQLDVKGYIKPSPTMNSTKTSEFKSATTIPGVFVSGDVHDHTYRQAITAAAFGCMAAMDTERWLDEQKEK